MTVTIGDWVWDEGFDMGAGAWLLEATWTDNEGALRSTMVIGTGGPDYSHSPAHTALCEQMLRDAIEHETA